MRKRNTPSRNARAPASLNVEPAPSASDFRHALLELRANEGMERASKALCAQLAVGSAELARAGFEALGDAIWAWPGFARDSLRALERCESPQGGACLSVWSRAAAEAEALPLALGRGGHARGQALAALGAAPFWASETSDCAARELGALLSLCVAEAPDQEAAGCVRSALGSWLCPERKSAKSAAALRLASETAAFELALRPLWLCAAGDGRQSAAFSLIERAGFARAAPVLLMAIGERGLLELRSRVDGRSLAHYASGALDEPAWRLALNRPELLGSPDELGSLPSEALGAWLNRLCESDSPRSARQLASAERMLRSALAAEIERPGLGFGPAFLEALCPRARALCERGSLGLELGLDALCPDPIAPPLASRASRAL